MNTFLQYDGVNVPPIVVGSISPVTRGMPLTYGGGESIPNGGGVFSLWWGCSNYGPFGQVKSQLLLITMLVKT